MKKDSTEKTTEKMDRIAKDYSGNCNCSICMSLRDEGGKSCSGCSWHHDRYTTLLQEKEQPKVTPASVNPVKKVSAFRVLNRAEEMMLTVISLVETANLLYPDMDKKFYVTVESYAKSFLSRIPKKKD